MIHFLAGYADKVALRSRFRYGRLGKGQDKDVFGLHALFLHARWGEIDLVAVSYTDTSARTSAPPAF
jgi:hypothetical protein